ncbi:MAG: putative amidohydrolase YtcJ [Cryomorphaceae bacterium]|jgi:predicted amidohydrolase YtcJ
MTKLLRLATVALVCGFVIACVDQAPETIAPMSAATELYHNGKIVTMDPTRPEVEAVAVRDGIILAVGSLSAVKTAAGDNVTHKDLAGKTMLPGLIDAHGHISYTALNLTAANVSSPPVGPAQTVDDVIQLLVQHRDKTSGREWIMGWGYDDSLLAEKRHPTRDDLDKVSTTQPVLIRHVSGHFLSCNSKCLELAGVDAQMPDPAGGIIRRRANSMEPDGVLEETAMGPLFAVVPTPDAQTRLKLLSAAQDYYASYGVTTVQDGAAQADEIDLLLRAAEQDLFYLDVVAFPYAPYLGERLADYPASRDYQNHFRVGGIKLVLDGSPQGKTAWLTKPYLHPPHGQNDQYAGYATLKDEQVQAFVDQAFLSNTPLLVHANGDAAADQLIKAVSEGNLKHGKADRRPVMIHAQTVREDQIDAMLEQGIMPSYFSAHTFYWGDWHRDSVFGVERASRISPLRSSADKGLRYTTHNDTPIVPPDMMRLLWASVNRVTRSGQVLGEAQRATVMEALKSITIDAAYQYFEEDRKGSITVGKLADFTVLSDNPLSVDAIEIKDIQVLNTVKDGAVVYSNSSEDSPL